MKPVKTSSNSAQGKLGNLLALLGAGDHRNAFAAAASLLEEEPDHAGAWTALAIAASYSGRREYLDAAVDAMEPVFEQLMELPEVVEIFGGLDLLPLVGSERFRKKLEGQLRAAQRRFQDGPPPLVGPAVPRAASTALLVQTERELHESPAKQEYVLVNVMKSAPIALLREGPVYSLGREPRAGVAIKIPEDEVSRAQCEMYICRGAVMVRDLRSTNGTFANGQEVGRGWAPLKLGEVLRLGWTEFTVVSRDTLPEPLPVVPGKDAESKGTLAQTMPMRVNESDMARLEREAPRFEDKPVPATRELPKLTPDAGRFRS